MNALAVITILQVKKQNNIASKYYKKEKAVRYFSYSFLIFSPPQTIFRYICCIYFTNKIAHQYFPIMKYFILILTLATITHCSFGQVNPQEKQKKMQQDFENFLKKENAKFKHYKDSVLTDYENFKKARWQEFEAFRTKGVFTVPKPRVLPPVKLNTMPLKPITVAPRIPKIITKPRITLPEDDFNKKTEEKNKINLRRIINASSQKVKVSFYGAEFYFFYNPINFSLYHLSQESITEAVKTINSEEDKYKPYLQQWSAYARLMHLNDYGFFLMVKKTCEKIYSNRNETTLFVWYILNKSGFDSKLGYTQQGDCLLLLPSKYPLLNRYQFTIDNKKYYAFDFNPDPPERYGNIFTYKGNPFNAKYQLDFLLSEVPRIESKQKINLFQSCNIPEKIELSSNISYVQFLNDMPMLDYQAYYYMPMSKKATERLDKEIKPFLKGKTALQQITFLLNFVQTAFPYQYDKEQFQKMERPQSAEEMLFYTKGDCEDHAALFSYLVLRYTNCDMVGILYPGHAAAAVRLPNGKRIKGCHLPAPYNDYILCEPTSNMRTPVGYIHSQYYGVVPERIFKVSRPKE